jgi:hypothetical protein
MKQHVLFEKVNVNQDLLPAAKKKKALTHISMMASGLLSKASFLTSVLCEHQECQHLAFKIGMFGLELPRPPAANKTIEVTILCLLLCFKNVVTKH